MSGSDVQSTFIAVQLASDDDGFSVAATLGAL
jgi:hypothetical protein